MDRIYRSRLSPSRRQINHQLDEHTYKMKELLRTDLNMLEQENALLKAKCKQIPQLEDKVEMVLKHNTQLLGQNEKLSKLANQRKAELQVVKSKLQSQLQNKMGENVAHEFELKKLIGEIEHLNNQIQELDICKNNQISDLKNQFHIDLQSQRKSYVAKQQALENQIKKLRDLLDRKEYQFQDYISQAKRITSESQYEISRLRDQKQKLKGQIIIIENSKKAEIEGIKARFQSHFSLEMEKMKRMHANAEQALEVQRVKLKDIVNQKNVEVQQTLARINKQKSFYDDNVELLRKENENIKNRLLDIQRINEQEFQALRNKLQQAHQTEIEQVKLSNVKLMQCLQQEITKLQAHVRGKNDQIQQLIKEKTVARQNFESQSGRLKQQYLVVQKRLKDLQGIHSRTIEDYERKIKEIEEQITYLNEINLDQAKNNERQQEFLKKLVQQAHSDSQKSNQSANQREQGLKELLNQSENDCAELREAVRKQKAQKVRAIQDMKNQLDIKISQLKAKLELLATKNSMLERQCDHLKEQMELKQKQINGVKKNLIESQERQKKMDIENQRIREKLIKKDQKMNQMLGDQKQRLQNSFAYTLDNLRHDHQAAFNLANTRYKNLEQKLIQKNDEVANLLKMYKKMKIELEHLTDQQANKKELTIKYPGATSDLLAIKNLFDVFLKTKVLDYCGDVLQQKQNFSK